jgi:hypothetical protein
VTELQRTPIEGSYQQSLFREFFFIYNVCQGRAAKQKDLGNFRIWFSGLGISTLGPGFSHSRFPKPKPENF